MDINVKNENNVVSVALSGRLDTTTAPAFESKLSEFITTANELVLDFSNLDYVSSAGLRVLLSAQKEMNKHGNMKLTNVKEEVMEVFEITGFSDILTIE